MGMTISVSASDMQYGRTLANGREIATPTRGPSFAWGALNNAIAAGKCRINIHNQFTQFADVMNVVMTIPDINTGTLSGVVTQELVNVARVVRLYRRSDGQLVASTTSNATTGAFSFTGLPAGVEYYVVYLDDEANLPNFNAKIFDQVVSV